MDIGLDYLIVKTFFVDILRVIKYCVKNTQNVWWIRKIVVILHCVKVTQIIKILYYERRLEKNGGWMV